MSERETTIQAMADETMFTIYSSESKWIRKIKKLSESHPKEVIITKIDYDEQDSNQEYSITAEVSKRYLKITPPRQRNLTEEQRTQLAERFKQLRNR